VPVKDILSIAQDNCSNMPYRPPDEQNQQFPFRNKYRLYAADRPHGNNPLGRYDGINSNCPNNHNEFNRNQGNYHNHDDSLLSEPSIYEKRPSDKHTYEELKLLITNPEITPEQEAKFKRLINEFGEIFALTNKELPGTDIFEFKIDVQQDARSVK